MSFWKTVSTLTCLSVFSLNTSHAVFSHWINPASSTWNTPGNWDNSIPPSSAADTSFFSQITSSLSIIDSLTAETIQKGAQMIFGSPHYSVSSHLPENQTKKI